MKNLDFKNKRTPKKIALAIVSVLTIGLVVGGCSDSPAENVSKGFEQGTQSAAVAGGSFSEKERTRFEAKASRPGALQRVENKKVCMINNKFMGKDQIPVPLLGNTYYGCCAMCEKTLKQDPSSRVSIDPVSGETVDKSLAIIGMKPGGAVLYFKSEATWQKYQNKG